MKITNTKEYRDALKAIREFEDHFNPGKTEGKPCYILKEDTIDSVPIVVLDEAIADHMYVEGKKYTMIKGILLGLDKEHE